MPTLFIPVVLLSLLSARAWSYVSIFTPELTQTCPSPANPLLHSYQSICRVGQQVFYNKACYQNATHNVDSTLSTINARKLSLKLENEKLSEFFLEFMPARETILKEMHNDVYSKWSNFFMSLIKVVERAKLRNDNLGFCSEAAFSSIANTMWRQLHTGERESIQLFDISGPSYGSGHSFAVYNAKIISNLEINNHDLATVINYLQPLDLKYPVEICDSWIDFHGPAHAWYNTFVNDPDSASRTTVRDKIKSTNYSIPSLRDGVNDKERAYLKRKMIDIISEIFPENSNRVKFNI